MENVKNNNLIQAVIDLQTDKEGAFEIVYRQSFKAAYSFASVMLKNAEDVFQTSYMYVAHSIKSFQSPDSFLSWLHAIVRFISSASNSQKFRQWSMKLLT